MEINFKVIISTAAQPMQLEQFQNKQKPSEENP